MLKEKDEIFAAIDGGSKAKRAHLKTGKHEQMEEAHIVWHMLSRSKNIPFCGDLLKERDLAIAAALGVVGFEASKGWLEKFKDRHRICFKDVQGEAGAVDIGSLRQWQQQVLCEALARFSADDVFNADETGLFRQLLPNKTMALTGE